MSICHERHNWDTGEDRFIIFYTYFMCVCVGGGVQNWPLTFSMWLTYFSSITFLLCIFCLRKQNGFMTWWITSRDWRLKHMYRLGLFMLLARLLSSSILIITITAPTNPLSVLKRGWGVVSWNFTETKRKLLFAPSFWHQVDDTLTDGHSGITRKRRRRAAVARTL